MSRMEVYRNKVAPIIKMLMEVCTEENIPVCVATVVQDEAGNEIAMQTENSGEMVARMMGEAMEERRANPQGD